MRLIDADALMDELLKGTVTTNDLYGLGVAVGGADAMNKIVKAPTIEAEPVRHGRWLDNEDYMFCSVCGMQWYYCDNETQDFKFCPNCGAKMDALTFEEASRKLGQQAAETLKKLKEAGYDPKR